MASTATINLGVQALDGGQSVRGRIRVIWSNGTPIPLELILTQSNLGTGYFKEVPWVGGLQSSLDYQQAVNYRSAFNRDHSSVGGTKNLVASVDPQTNVITITAKTGIFTLIEYTGDILTFAHAINNGSITQTVTFSSAIQNTGDCNTIDYLVSATNELQPYSLKVDGVDILTGWNGSSTTIQLSRSGFPPKKLTLHDGSGELASNTEIVPRNLVASEFKQETKPFIGYSDIEILEVNPVLNTDPMYALADTDGSNKGTYQGNNFPGILDGTYRLYIRDKYGCEVFQTISVSSAQQASVENFRQLGASALNSLSFAKPVDFDAFNKKNHQNTISANENIPLRYTGYHDFVVADIEPIQFWSSYPFMVVTLRKCDGTKQEIPFEIIQENLGFTERVDCEIYPIDGKIGVYFDGGNEYEPNTTTVIDASEHTNSLPDWANVGQQVSLVGQGVKTIEEKGFDSDLGKSYFTVSGTIPSAQSDIIQVIYNRQEYNLFQFYLSMQAVTDIAWVTIEAGFTFEEIDSYLISEPIRIIEDNDDYLLVEWKGDKNIGNMVYTNTDMSGKMRVKGFTRPVPISEADTEEVDDRAYSLLQSSGVAIRAEIPLLTFNQWDKLNKAMAVSQAGVFKINGLELIRSSSMEHDELGATNYSNVTVEFAMGGENSSVNSDEIVTNPSTGVIGSGSSGKTGFIIPPYDGQLRLTLGGELISIGGNLITLD